MSDAQVAISIASLLGQVVLPFLTTGAAIVGLIVVGVAIGERIKHF